MGAGRGPRSGRWRWGGSPIGSRLVVGPRVPGVVGLLALGLLVEALLGRRRIALLGCDPVRHLLVSRHVLAEPIVHRAVRRILDLIVGHLGLLGLLPGPLPRHPTHPNPRRPSPVARRDITPRCRSNPSAIPAGGSRLAAGSRLTDLLVAG